jgi:multimeric flavodoxin WrbA
MAAFLDQAGGLWARGALHGKVGAAFTSTATQHGGQETTLFSVITNMLHFGMIIVGLDYGFAGQMTLAVTGEESVTVPAGTFAVYRAELTGGPQPLTFFVTKEAPFRLVKVSVPGTPIEIQLIR